jgi:uncharacterized membrane protein YdbT with pleckstrin-like domain
MPGMGYPAKLLGAGEQVEFEMKPHWRALMVPFVWLLGEIFIGVALWFYIDVSFVRWVIFIVCAVIFVVFAVRPFLYWLTTDYVFTNRRIIVRGGFIARSGRDMPLSKVNNVSFDISVMGRILNYGKLTVDSASDEALVINDVPSVEHIQREVNRLHEEDDLRRRKGVTGSAVLPDDGT